MKGAEGSSIVTGILYQHKGSTDTQLVGGLSNSIKLFNGVPITGFTSRGENATEDNLVSGVQVAGIVHQSEAGLDEQILRSEKLKGVIFQHREVAHGDGGGPENVNAAQQASSLPQEGPLSGSQIVGIVCRDQNTGEERLTTGARADLKILNGAAIVGIIVEGIEGEVIKRVNGFNITGLLFQQEKSTSETLVGDMVLLGLIYQEKGDHFKRLANSQNTVSMITTSILYVILILGVLGLLLPAMRSENDFSPLNFIGLPSTAIITLLVLMLVVPITILIYRMYGRSHSISPI